VIQFETITCPYCWEPIEITLDLTVESQQQVEDCSVCCRPIVVRYSTADGEHIVGWDKRTEEQVALLIHCRAQLLWRRGRIALNKGKKRIRHRCPLYKRPKTQARFSDRGACFSVQEAEAMISEGSPLRTAIPFTKFRFCRAVAHSA